jgi:PAS domain S-box-containing protein
MLQQPENADIFKFIVEASPNAIILVNSDRRIVFINKFAEDLFQYSKQEIRGKKIEVLVPEKQQTKHPDYVESYLQKPETRPMGAGRDLYAVKKDKSRFPAEIALNEAKIADESYVLAVVLDITERKKTEKIIRESNARLDVFFKQSVEGFFFMMLDEPVYWHSEADKESLLDYVFDHQRITRINDAMLKQYGAKKEDFIGLTPKDFFPHDMAHGREVWRKFFDTGKLHIDTQEQKLDGTPMNIYGDYVCMYDEEGRITGHFGIQREITKERRAEIALKENEHKLKTIFDILDVGISITDEQGNIIDCNKASERILGITKEQHLSRNYSGSEWEIIRPDGSLMPEEEYASVKSLDENRPVRNTEMGIIKADNRISWIIVNAAPIDIEGYGVVVTYFDITERKLVQTEYETILSTTQDGFFITDDEANILEANDAFCEMLGYTRSEILQLSIPDIEGSQKPEDVAARMGKIFVEGYDVFETKHRRKDNTLIDIEISVTLVNVGIIKLIVFARDITKRKQAELVIKQANQQLERQNKQINRSIQYAERIQFSILPEMADIRKFLPDASVFFKPKNVIGGDFYWFHHAENCCYIAAIDCTGHNVPGAMMTMTVHSLLNEIMIRDKQLSTGEILGRLHNRLFNFLQQHKGDAYSQDGCDISLCKLNVEDSTIQFSGAHQDLYLIKPDSYTVIQATRKSVGGYSLLGEKEPERFFETQNITVEDKPIIAMTTDGVTDQLNENDRVFEREKFVSLIQNNYNSERQLSEIIKQSVEAWTENAVQQDDFLTITFKMLSKP